MVPRPRSAACLGRFGRVNRSLDAPDAAGPAPNWWPKRCDLDPKGEETGDPVAKRQQTHPEKARFAAKIPRFHKTADSTRDARFGTRPGVRKTKRELLQTRCRPELLLLRPPDPAVARGELERARLPADQREPGLDVQRDMARALADDAVEPQAMMLLDQAVPEPVLTPATGRAHRDRAQVDGRIRRRKNHHGQHAATSRTISWLVSAETASPKSPRAGHRADNEVALRKSHAEKAGHSQKNSPWFAHQRILTFFTRV